MTTPSPAVVVVGSLNTDHLVRVDRLPEEGETVMAGDYLVAAGGKGLNQAVAAARQGVPVALVGCVGGDDAGRRLLDLLVGEGVDVSHVRVASDMATGVALVTVADGGANTIVVAAQANRLVAPSDIAAAGSMIQGCAVLLAQLEVPEASVEAAVTLAAAAGVTTVLNPAPVRGPLPPSLLGRVAILVANATEATALGGADAGALRVLGPSKVVVTLGAAGAVAASEDGVARVAPFPIRAVDTTGAGDAFCGVLAAAIADGLTFPAALRRASAAGALASTISGAVPSLPSAAAVDVLLASGSTSDR